MTDSREGASPADGERGWGKWTTVVILLLVAVGGHWAWHYRPRVRSLPFRDQGIGRLWTSEESEVAVWLAYPHQNLGALEDRVGDLDSYLADLGTVMEDEPLRIPHFGPFRFPPASQMLATRAATEPRWRGAARVYPSVALLAKGAGRLTGNAWLGGGVVDDNSELRVGWQGALWTLGSLESGPEPTVEDDGSEDVVARLRVGRPLGSWPPGDYALRVDDGDIWLTESGVAPAAVTAVDAWARSPGVVLAVQEGDSTGQRLLLFFDHRDEAFPGVVSVARGMERRKLPGERLFGRLGAEVVERQHRGWQLAAYSEADLAAVVQALPRSDAVRDGWSAYLTAGPAAALAARIGGTLEQIPIIGEREAESWLALSRLLEPLGTDGTVEVSLAKPAYVRLSDGGHD